MSHRPRLPTARLPAARLAPLAGAMVAALVASWPGSSSGQEVPALGPLGSTSNPQAAGANALAPSLGGAPPVPGTAPRSPDSIRSAEAGGREPDPARTGGVETARGVAPELAQPGELGKPREAREVRREPTDFQQFAAVSVGRLLAIFGQDLFGGAPGTFAPVIDAPPSADYLIGPGDELVIRGWGLMDLDVRAVVSREGTINIPRVGVVSVAGTRYDDLAARIKAAVSRYYRNFEISVSLGRLRSIQVFLVGHAKRPGLYTVNALSTMVNVLFAAGGPSPTGSMRRIQLRRGGKAVGTLDLYDVLLGGDKSGDQRLVSGDVIFVPTSGPMAAIAGSVKDPGIFELRPEETTFADLVGYAGDLTTTAATQSVLLERLDQRRGRVVEELPWNEAARAMRVRDGDVVQFRRVSPRFDNAVTVRGSVIAPFRTAWRPGLTVADLIPDRGALISNGYWARAAARAFENAPSRARADAPGLRGEPREREGARDAEAERDRARDRAREREPGEHDATDVENLVDEVNWDYAVIERLERARLEPRLIPFSLGKAILDRDPQSNPALEPGDIVTVFSQRDILAPGGKRSYFVRLEGELVTPGVYQVRAGETLRQLLKRAGGLTAKAYLFGAELNRESVRKEQQARLEEIAGRAEQELERSAAERLARAVSPEDTLAVRAQVEGQRAAIARMKTLRATGRMVLEVQPEASRVEDLPDLVLEDGDRLLVPMLYSTVGVYGAVYNQASFIHKGDKSLDDYLRQAGGPTRFADSGSTYVLRADGSVVSRRQSGWFGSFGSRRLMPNDNIVVPEDYAPVSWVKELKDWSQIFYQFGLGVAAIKILKG